HFFFTVPATTQSSTLSLHDALPIFIAELAGDLPRAPIAKILGVGLAKNSGVRRGMVRDIDETTRSVAAALKDAERMAGARVPDRSEEHTSELQSRSDLVCRLLLEKK